MTLDQQLKIIPIDGPRADALLEHINTARWAGGRPAELLRLVAYLSDYPQFTPIRSWHIRGLGRTPRQARYDHQVMVRLAGDRVLQRVAIARGDVWRVNPDLRHWRGVPGIPSWRRVVSLFSDPFSDICARRGPNAAGQRLASAPYWADSADVDGVPLSATDLSRRARHMARGGHRPGETPARYGAPRAAAALPIPSLSLIPSSSFGEAKEEEVEKLVQTIRDATGKGWIRGKQRAPIEQLCSEFPDRIPDLIALAPVLIAREQIQWPSMAALVLRERAVAGRWELESNPDDTSAELARQRRLEELPRLIATWEAAGAEPEAIARLRSELEDLGGL